MLTRQQWHELGISVTVGAIFGCIGYFTTKYIVSAIKQVETKV